MSFFDGGFGALAGGVLKTVGGLIGSHQDRNFARAQSEADRAFQREVFQNQLQWKAADARKAGLHPLAALGGGAYSASPSSVSVPGSSLGDGLGKLGQGIGDAFAAYKNKAQLAAELAWREEEKQMKRDEHDANMRKSAAETLMLNGQALESTNRARSYTVPMATGFESIPGQVDAPPTNMGRVRKYDWVILPDGSHGDPVPSSELSEAYENAPGVFAYTPYIDAMFDKWSAILTGSPIDGRYHDWRTNTWTREKPPAIFRFVTPEERKAELKRRHARWSYHFPSPRY